MEDQEKNIASENPNSQPHDPKKDIPLWLQGLEEDSTPSQREEDPSSEGWTKEAAAAFSADASRVEAEPAGSLPDKQEDTAEMPAASTGEKESGDALPDWLNELSEESSTSSVSEEERQQGFYTADDEPDAVIPGPESHPSEGAFIDISEVDLGHAGENPAPGQDEMLPDDEELPEWLHEMIAETPEADFAETAAGKDSEASLETSPEVGIAATASEAVLDEETAPIAVPEAMPEASPSAEQMTEPETAAPIEESEADNLPEMALAKRFGPVEELEETLPHPIDLEIGPETAESAIDAVPEKAEGAALMSTPAGPEESLEALDAVEEDAPTESEHTQPVSIPKTLRFAKYVLDQGDIGRALDIIHTYIKQASYLDEIKGWLVDAASTSPAHQSEIWETIGDIAVCQSNYQEAFTAYTKAIKNLLLHKEAHGTH